MEFGNTHLLFCNHDCGLKMCINIRLKQNMYYETNYSYFPKHEKCESDFVLYTLICFTSP